MQYPKPQRQTKKHQPQGKSRQMMTNHQGNDQSQQNNYYQGPHNITTYMDLPSSMQSKICGRCGLMGHIKRFCKEEVYCKYCKIYTHYTTACRTYPAMSSRKNTPEKRTPEDIDQEVNRRVQEEMLHILTDLSTNRQVANNQGTPYPKKGSTQIGVSNQPVNENTPYQHIPERRQEVQNLIGEFQRPPEVTEQEPSASNNPGQTEENRNQDPILNQQWDEPLHLQPPMRPTSIPTSQTTNSVANTLNPNITMGGNVETLTTHRQVETLMEEGQGRRSNDMRPTGTDIQANMRTFATNRRVEQTSCTHCSCPHQLSGGTANTNVEDQRLNLHTEYEDRNNGVSKFFRGRKHMDENGSRGCQIIRILPDESDDYMNIVRDSVSAQTRGGPKPMFVNNYFVGDNNWRTVPKDKPDLTRHIDESRSRSSTGVQTAVSFLGEVDKGSNILQTGLERVKSMGNNEADCNVRSPVVVEPMKHGNSTGWSTHSFNIPDPQQDVPGQQCKGLPDFTVPPPPIPPQGSTQRCSDRGESVIL